MSPHDRSSLLSLLQDARFRVLEKLASDYTQKIQSEPTIQYTEWDVVKSSLAKQYKVEGITQFLQEIYNQANDTNRIDDTTY